nr:MAG TPA: hypothetical protein [Caudoviricetes sp.]
MPRSVPLEHILYMYSVLLLLPNYIFIVRPVISLRFYRFYAANAIT